MDKPLLAQRRGFAGFHTAVHDDPQRGDDSVVVQWMAASCPPTGSVLSTGCSTRSARSRLQPLVEIGDLFVDRLAFAHLAGNLFDRMNHGGVITPAE